MKHSFFVIALVILAAAAPVSANSRIKIDTVPSEYTPLNRPAFVEPVSMSGYHFEVNAETGRARVVVDYTYPDQIYYGPDDDAGGPLSTVAQLPGLTYDEAAHEVIYESNGAKTVCATVTEESGFFGHHLKVKKSEACTVTTVVADHAEDTGWNIHRFRVIDAYFEVH
jgi:hypothetical protein